MAVLSNMVASGLGSKKSAVEDFIISKTGQIKKPETSQQELFNSFAAIATPYKGPSER